MDEERTDKIIAIALSFPGLFSYTELMNLSAEDFEAWYEKANRRNA